MKKQRGVTLTGLLMVSVVLIFVLLLGFKLFKPYTEYFAIQKIFRSLVIKPEVRNGTRGDLKVAWQGFATIEGISSITVDDIEIAKDGTNVILSAAYQAKVPLFKNFTLLIDFYPSSAAAGP